MFINRGNLDIDTHIDRMPREHESREWGGTSVSQKCWNFPENQQKPGERPAIIVDFELLKLWDNTFLLFKAPSLWKFVTAALEN